MMLLYITLFSLIGGVFSLIGGFILLKNEVLAQKISIHLISFAAGVLLGVAFLDLFPEAVEAGLSVENLFTWALIGFAAFFVLEGIILKLHHHHHAGEKHYSSPTPWILLLADSLHNFLDGVAIAAAFFISIPLGIVTSFAVAAHEIPQEVADFAVMLSYSWKKNKVLFWNIISALMTTIGALLTFSIKDVVEPVVPLLLAIIGGVFTYIAATDLLPDLYEREHHDKLSHIIMLFLLGIFVVWVLIKFL